MSDIFAKIAENRIQEAYEQGEFNNLKGFGMPIDNGNYFSVPPEDRIAFHLLKNSGFIPEEVELRKELFNVSQALRSAISNEEKEEWRMKYVALTNKILILSENRKIRR